MLIVKNYDFIFLFVFLLRRCWPTNIIYWPCNNDKKADRASSASHTFTKISLSREGWALNAWSTHLNACCFFHLYNSFLLSHYHICLIERIVPNENKYFIELFLFELSLLDVEYYCFNFLTMELFEISILWIIFMTFMWQIWTHHSLNIFNLVISYNEWLLCLNYSSLSVLFRGEKLWDV